MAEPVELPSQEELQRRFTYSPVTGELYSNRTGRPVGWKTPSGYVRCELARGCQPNLHRVIWKLVTGEEPNPTINHIDEVKDNNAWHNLELATHSEQILKQSKHRQNPRRCIDEPWPGYYRVRYKRDGKFHLVGYYYSLEEAQAARDEYFSL